MRCELLIYREDEIVFVKKENFDRRLDVKKEEVDQSRPNPLTLGLDNLLLFRFSQE